MQKLLQCTVASVNQTALRHYASFSNRLGHITYSAAAVPVSILALPLTLVLNQRVLKLQNHPVGS